MSTMAPPSILMRAGSRSGMRAIVVAPSCVSNVWSASAGRAHAPSRAKLIGRKKLRKVSIGGPLKRLQVQAAPRQAEAGEVEAVFGGDELVAHVNFVPTLE